MKSLHFWILVLSFSVLGTTCQRAATDCNLTSILCSCDRTDVGSHPDCRDYDFMSPETAEEQCKSDSGVFSETALCPTATRVGTCKFTVGSQITYQRYYLADVADAAAGAATCAYFKANCFVISGGALCDAVWTEG